MRHLLIALFAPLLAHAQPAVPLEFPDGATALSADALQQRLAGKVFDVKLGNGMGWRLEYKRNGYYFVDTSTGARDDGQWRVEDSRLCNEARRGTSACSEVRDKDGVLYLKRQTTGEVIAFTPR